MTAPFKIEEYELYRVILDYEALHEGFIDRIEDLNVPRGEIDAAGGFTQGHASKLLCSPPMKMLGRESLGKMLKATGMALILAIDDARFAPIKSQLMKRRRRVAPGIKQKTAEKPVDIEELMKKERQSRMREIGMKGNKSNKRREAAMKRRARQRKAQHAARKRWSKRK